MGERLTNCGELIRVLRRLGDRMILDQTAKRDAPHLILNLFQCGFTGEDQLVEQLVEILGTPPRRHFGLLYLWYPIVSADGNGVQHELRCPRPLHHVLDTAVRRRRSPNFQEKCAATV